MNFSKLTLFLALILSGGAALCQAGPGFQRLGVNDGLSQNSVREIFQDQQGFMWIGTGDGLNRYDGRQIKKYRESFRDKSPKNFPGKIITGKFIQDKHQNLWMIVDGQLVKMNMFTERFTVVKKIGGDLDCRILGLFDNKIIVAGRNNILSVNVNDHTLTTFPVSNAIGIYVRNDQLYILLLRENRLLKYHAGSGVIEKMNIPVNTGIGNTVVYNNSDLLFYSGKKIYDYSLPADKITAVFDLSSALKSDSALVVVPNIKTPKGDIVATIHNRGIIIIDSITGAIHQYGNVENNLLSLSSNLIYDAVIDHSHNLWLGTEGGGISVLNLKPALFNAFPLHAVANRESAFLMVKSIFHNNGNIYIGTYSKGLYIVNRLTGQYKQLFAPATDKFAGIFFLFKDKAGHTWMNQGDKIGTFDTENEQFDVAANIEYKRKGRSHNIPQCFTQVAADKYLTGTNYSTYLIYKENGRFAVTDLGLKNKIFEDDIQTFFVKDNGDIIIGKGEGKGYITVRIDHLNQPKIVETGLVNFTIKHIYRDSLRGAFWFATNVGLIIKRDDTRELLVIDEEDGLSNDYIYSIIPENNYIFWLSTNHGINKLTLKKTKTIQVNSIEAYAIQHGLQSNEFNTGAYYKDGPLIFFGGVTGINWFDERKFFKRRFIPRTFVTNLFINERPFQTDTAVNFLKHIHLSHEENNIHIKFATLDYTNPHVNQYQYRLGGYDNQWIHAYNIPEARYSKLPHGTYHFEVRSANSEGVWSAPQLLQTIVISPPFWLTWWFKTLAIVSILGASFLSVRYFLKRKLQKQLRVIEKQLAVNNERLRISRDMHDELGTGLSKIALLSEVGRSARLQEANEKIINEISSTSRGLADKMGEIIWTLNPHNDTLSNLAAYLHEYISETTEQLPVKIDFFLPENIPDISLGHLPRQQIMLVTKEALNNALKYSKASRISFAISIEGRQIVFLLSDNGTGFDAGIYPPQKNGKRNGLMNMKARMTAIGGDLVIQSAKSRGTKIIYSIKT